MKLRFLLVALGLYLGLIWLIPVVQTPRTGDAIRLQSPPFIGQAKAQSDSSFLANEAGISAYTQATAPINLSYIRTVFRTIETETADYIIGSVEVAGYGTSEDVHLYVSADGWLLAYYLAADPISKIFNLDPYVLPYSNTSIPTKLESVLQASADHVGATISGITYYDFRYPNATHLMLITKQGNNPFTVKLPDSFEYYERGWALGVGGINSLWAKYLVNGIEVGSASTHDPTYGKLTFNQLLPNVTHNLRLQKSYADDVYGGLAVIYRMP